ncbi:MAG: hypothetical protein WD794_08000 [Mycobacteriales bacterium]
MGRHAVTVSRLEEHANLPEILGVLAQLPHIGDGHLVALADAWVNSPALAEARGRALSPDSPLVVEVLAAFDALTALFADDLAGTAAYVLVDATVTIRALKAVRDAIAASYARPVLTRHQHTALLRPWHTVFPTPTVDEPDLGPRAEQVKTLLSTLPGLSVRCHDASGRALFEALVDRSFVAEADRAQAAQTAFDAAVLTSRRRTWTLVRRSGTEGLLRPCPTCRASTAHDREGQRVLELCLDAACALLVADALSDACLHLLADPVLALIPMQRAGSS